MGVHSSKELAPDHTLQSFYFNPFMAEDDII